MKRAMLTASFKPFGRAALAGVILLVLLLSGMRSLWLDWACRQAEALANQNGISLEINGPSWEGLLGIAIESAHISRGNWEVHIGLSKASLAFKNIINKELAPSIASIDSIQILRHARGIPRESANLTESKTPHFTLERLISFIPDRFTIGECQISLDNRGGIAFSSIEGNARKMVAQWEINIENDRDLSDQLFRKISTNGLGKLLSITHDNQIRGNMEASLIPASHPSQFSFSCSSLPAMIYHPSLGPAPIHLPQTHFVANGEKQDTGWNWNGQFTLANEAESVSLHWMGCTTSSKGWQMEAKAPAEFVTLAYRLSGEGNLPGISQLTRGNMPSLRIATGGEGFHLQRLSIQTDESPTIQANERWRESLAAYAQPAPILPHGEEKAIFPHIGNNPQQKWAKWNPALIPAILLSEDDQFYTHSGINWDFLAMAANDNLSEGSFSRGGGTISMQLVRNLWLNRDKNLLRKVDELALTGILESEQLLSKDQILDLYLQIIEWGPGVYGLPAAAEFYFAKPVEALEVDEILLLCYFIPNPKQFAKAFQPNGELTESAAAYIETMRWLLQESGHLQESDLDAPLPNKEILKGLAGKSPR